MLLSAAHKIIKEKNVKKNAKEGIPITENKCFICNKTFSLILRQHKCKNCLKAVCTNCSPKKLIVHQYDPSNKTHRVCNVCYPRLSKITSNTKTIHKYEANGLTETTEINNDNVPLTDPNINSISVWLSIFEKCWLRTKYPHYYKTKQKELLHSEEEPILTRKRQKIPSKIKKDKDESNPITIIKAGTLWINIIEAMGIPNHNPLDKPDIYLRYYVTDNIYDKQFTESTEYTTKVVNNSFSPEWNTERTIPIYNTTGKLIIEIWDKDLTSSKYLGRISLKLSRLFLHYSCDNNDNDIIDDWFEAEILDKYKNKISNKIHDINDKLIHLVEAIEEAPIYTKVESIPNMRSDDSKKNNKCYIHLQLKLRTSFWANFISHFDPVLPKPKKVTFNFNLTVDEVNKLLVYLFPIIEYMQDDQIKILTWIKYQWSIVYVLLFTSFVYHPWFFTFYIQMRLLVYICSVYINNSHKVQYQHLQEIPLFVKGICNLFGYIPLIVRKIMKRHEQDQKKEKHIFHQSFMMTSRTDLHSTSPNTDDDDEYSDDMDVYGELIKNDQLKDPEITVSAFGAYAAKKTIQISGAKPVLWPIQEMLVMMNESLAKTLKIIEWHKDYYTSTCIIVISLFLLSVFSILTRDSNLLRHEIYIVGLFILCYYSKPIQFILWLSCGFSYWYIDYYQKYTQFKMDNGNIEQQTSESGLSLNTPTTISNLIMNDDFANNLNGNTKDNKQDNKQNKLGYFMQIWLKFNAIILWILIKIFYGSKKKKVVDNMSLTSQSSMLSKNNVSDNKQASKKAMERRKEILNLYNGSFEKKFQFILSRLKQGKLLCF